MHKYNSVGEEQEGGVEKEFGPFSIFAKGMQLKKTEGGV